MNKMSWSIGSHQRSSITVDQMMLNKFWQCVAENRSVVLDGSVLEWLR